MDTLEQYRNTIKNILTRYYDMTSAHPHFQDDFELSDRLAFDEQRDQYLWFRFGWDGKKLVQHIVMYLSIKNGKV